MRLAIDASNISEGGGPTHLIEFLRAARPFEYGFDQVVVWTNRCLAEKLPEKPWLKVMYDPVLDRPISHRIIWQTTKFTKWAQVSCDILFFPGGTYLGSFRPFVTMSQNMIPFDKRARNKQELSIDYLRLRLLYFIQKLTFQRADGLIFLTKFAYSSIINQVKKVRGQCTIIPHGIKENFFHRPRSQCALNKKSSANPFHFLYVSSLVAYKNHAELAIAIAHLYRSGMPVQLDLIGWSNPFVEKKLRVLIKNLNLPEGSINYIGPVPYEKMPEVYQHADVFVFASSCESFGLALGEAMASGLPIACSNRGPLPEVLGDAGVYFDPENPNDIAAVLRRLVLAPDLRQQKAQFAYERAKTYSWERCAQETLAFLSQIYRMEISTKNHAKTR